jgi:hypothetical protein
MSWLRKKTSSRHACAQVAKLATNRSAAVRVRFEQNLLRRAGLVENITTARALDAAIAARNAWHANCCVRGADFEPGSIA